jgi:hypothetical protein
VSVDLFHAFTRDWMLATLFEKALYLVVCIAGVVSFERAVRLSWLVFAPLTRRRRLEALLAAPEIPAEQIARLALAGGIVAAHARSPSKPDADIALDGAARHRLWVAQSCFSDSWRIADARVADIRALLCLTILIILLAAMQASEMAFSDRAMAPWDWRMYEAAHNAATRWALMLPTSFGICLAWTVFDAALHRRRAAWDHSVATARHRRTA